MDTPYVSIVMEDIPSTQDEAVANAQDAPVLVVAARQTAGRGRSGSRWENAPRALAASLAVRPLGWESPQLPRLSLMAALSARSVLGGAIACKWPNDLVKGDGKVAGLLLEAVGDLVVIGLGVNVWWPDPPPRFAGLLDDDPGPERGPDLARRWCEDLLIRLEQGPDRWGREEYRRACRTIGRSIRWKPEGSGVAVDVDEDGHLVVETGSGRVSLSSGAVWEIR